MKKLENKVAVITGGNSGMGLETAKEFALNGARVAISGRNQETLDSAVLAIGHDALGVKADVASLADIDRFYRETYGKFGNFDVLVVNAGIFKGAPLADFTEELFDEISGINFKGAFFSVQKALPFLNDGASIIITASTVNEKTMLSGSVYAATKAAVTSLARNFSAELLDRRIRVNVLSPGPIETPILGRNGGSQADIDGVKNYLSSITPLKRLGTVQEMAKGFLYLASDDSSFMLGAELLLDGGFKTF